jgi:hypothetical protein
LASIFLSPFSFEVTLFTVGGDLPVTVQSGRSSPTVNNGTSKLNDDRKISTNSKQCHFKTEVTLFTVGVDLPVTV